MDGARPAGSSRELSTTVIMAIAAMAMTLVAIFGEESFKPLTVAASLAGLVPWALLVGGVRIPLPAFAAFAVLVGFLVVFVDLNPGGVFPWLVAILYVIRSSGSTWLSVAMVAAAAAAIIGATIREGSASETGMVYFLGGLGITWLSGRMLRRQDQLTAELQVMQELRMEHAAAAERTHIAREVHDIVAHSMTVVMLHLTGARRALATDPDRADEALARAEAVGRESLDGIRQMIGLLRSDEQDRAAGTEQPLPGIADLPELIDSYRSGGLTVAADINPACELDPAAQLIVYRIVQESLSNVLQHAAGAPSTVRVAPPATHPDGTAGGDSSLVVDVVNEAPARQADVAYSSDRRAGLGLRGMAERLRAYGGSFSAGPTLDGGWRVHSTLPMRKPTGHQEPWTPTPTAR